MQLTRTLEKAYTASCGGFSFFDVFHDFVRSDGCSKNTPRLLRPGQSQIFGTGETGTARTGNCNRTVGTGTGMTWNRIEPNRTVAFLIFVVDAGGICPENGLLA